MAEIKRERTSDRETIILGGELTITHLERVKKELQDSIRTSSAVQLRFDGVRDMDIAFLQLLCSAHRTASDEQKPLTLDGELVQFRALMNLSGFQRHIGCCEQGQVPCLWFCDNRNS